ncbi:MAG: hypothetical protein NUK65_08990 [Firmicutes bacterium]|nr:hypothetical protein [Bacillota bacterium]
MRKPLILAIVILLGLMSVKMAVSYSSASVLNSATLTLAQPKDGLVSLVCLHEPFTIEQGEEKDFLLVTNNIARQIRYTLDSNDSNLTLSPNGASIGSKETITLTVPMDHPVGKVKLRIVLYATWSGGSAEITTTVPITINAVANNPTVTAQAKTIILEEKTEPVASPEKEPVLEETTSGNTPPEIVEEKPAENEASEEPASKVEEEEKSTDEISEDEETSEGEEPSEKEETSEKEPPNDEENNGGQ